MYRTLLAVLRKPQLRSGEWSQVAVRPSDDGDPSYQCIVCHVWLPRRDAGSPVAAGASVGGAAWTGALESPHSVPVLVVVNMSERASTGHVMLSEIEPLHPALGIGSRVLLCDALSDTAFDRTVDAKGIWFGLAPFEARIFDVCRLGA